MKILIQTRSTFQDLSGGDRVQLEQTAAALQSLGHDITIEHGRYRSDLGQFQVLHLFNMQIEPHCFLLYLIQAERAGIPVALSTIYWNPDQWKQHLPRYDREHHQSFGDKLRNILTYKFRGISPLVVFKYLLSSPDLRHWLWLALTRPASGQATHFVKTVLIKRCQIILPNGQSEAEQIRRDFAQPQRVAVIPNGISQDFSSSDPRDFISRFGHNDFVLSVGRIETRKNTLALVKACRQLRQFLVLIGNDKIEPDYTAEVKATGADGLLIIAEMPQQQLGSAYRAAKIHALVSWFETPGLSSLEAAAAGCKIVTTKIGTTKEYFADLAFYCDPADPTTINSALEAALKAASSDQLRERITSKYTWKAAANATARAYSLIVGKP
jgi:glycosyltransferase involved in cell wall biosynthesis